MAFSGGGGMGVGVGVGVGAGVGVGVGTGVGVGVGTGVGVGWTQRPDTARCPSILITTRPGCGNNAPVMSPDQFKVPVLHRANTATTVPEM